jgi:hypothetical protein
MKIVKTKTTRGTRGMKCAEELANFAVHSIFL